MQLNTAAYTSNNLTKSTGVITLVGFKSWNSLYAQIINMFSQLQTLTEAVYCEMTLKYVLCCVLHTSPAISERLGNGLVHKNNKITIANTICQSLFARLCTLLTGLLAQVDVCRDAHD